MKLESDGPRAPDGFGIGLRLQSKQLGVLAARHLQQLGRRSGDIGPDVSQARVAGREQADAVRRHVQAEATERRRQRGQAERPRCELHGRRLVPQGELPQGWQVRERHVLHRHSLVTLRTTLCCLRAYVMLMTKR